MLSRSLISIALFVAACEGAPPPMDTPDAGSPIGALPDAGCSWQFGNTYFLDSIAMLPPNQGIDLNGDGVPDNVLGALGPFANPGWVQSIAMGSVIILIDITHWPAAT